jgi:hypothetical protein
MIERIQPLLAGSPVLAGRQARMAFREQTHLDEYFSYTTGFDWSLPAPELATHLLGSCAHIIPVSEGPRRGWTVVGELLNALVAARAPAPDDLAWLAALILRYRLIPTPVPEAEVTPILRAALAATPPTPPPYWEMDGMFPRPMMRAMRIADLEKAIQAGQWVLVLMLVAGFRAEAEVPELAEQLAADLAAHKLDLDALETQARQFATPDMDSSSQPPG